MACANGAEHWGRVYVESDDPVEREAALQIIGAAQEAGRERVTDLAIALFGGGDS